MPLGCQQCSKRPHSGIRRVVVQAKKALLPRATVRTEVHTAYVTHCETWTMVKLCRVIGGTRVSVRGYNLHTKDDAMTTGVEAEIRAALVPGLPG
jgi:hypothetical protein